MMSCFIWLYFVCMVATVRENYLKNEIFSRSGKSRNFVDGQLGEEKLGNFKDGQRGPGKFRKDLQSQGKVREFQNKWLWQAVFRKFIILFKRGRMFYLMR